jgi:hypothetical protein
VTLRISSLSSGKAASTIRGTKNLASSMSYFLLNFAVSSGNQL